MLGIDLHNLVADLYTLQRHQDHLQAGEGTMKFQLRTPLAVRGESEKSESPNTGADAMTAGSNTHLEAHSCAGPLKLRI